MGRFFILLSTILACTRAAPLCKADNLTLLVPGSRLPPNVTPPPNFANGIQLTMNLSFPGQIVWTVQFGLVCYNSIPSVAESLDARLVYRSNSSSPLVSCKTLAPVSATVLGGGMYSISWSLQTFGANHCGCGCGGEYQLRISRAVSDTTLVDARGVIALRAEDWAGYRTDAGWQPLADYSVLFKAANVAGEAGRVPSSDIRRVLGPFPLYTGSRYEGTLEDRPDVRNSLAVVTMWSNHECDANPAGLCA
mmetsp:Transcript_55959/g.147985  ORF Transcript_55959/g.147985 Transcript_55959/m.147985 type:complete len:250 (-) Transcript_55959:91-840(-)